MAILGDIGSKLTGGADASTLGSGLLQGFTILFGLIFIGIVIAIAGYFYWNAKRFSKKIMIAKKVGGTFIIAGKDKARVVKIGDMGNEILKLKKMKVFRATKGILIDKDTYLFVIDEEGNWLNVGLSDINIDLKTLKYEIPSNDARMANVSIRRLNEKQFEKASWMQQNIGLLVGGVVIVVVLIFMWLMASKYFTIFEAQKSVIIEQKELVAQNKQSVEATTRLIEGIDKLVSGGASFTYVNNSLVQR